MFAELMYMKTIYLINRTIRTLSQFLLDLKEGQGVLGLEHHTQLVLQPVHIDDGSPLHLFKDLFRVPKCVVRSVFVYNVLVVSSGLRKIIMLRSICAELLHSFFRREGNSQHTHKTQIHNIKHARH